MALSLPTVTPFDRCRIGFELCSVGERLWRIAIGVDHVKQPEAWKKARAEYDRHVEACSA